MFIPFLLPLVPNDTISTCLSIVLQEQQSVKSCRWTQIRNLASRTTSTVQFSLVHWQNRWILLLLLPLTSQLW